MKTTLIIYSVGLVVHLLVLFIVVFTALPKTPSFKKATKNELLLMRIVAFILLVFAGIFWFATDAVLLLFAIMEMRNVVGNKSS